MLTCSHCGLAIEAPDEHSDFPADCISALSYHVESLVKQVERMHKVLLNYVPNYGHSLGSDTHQDWKVD